MFSVIANIYNKKTKEPSLTELFTATGKLKKKFFDNSSCQKNFFQFSCGCKKSH